MTRFFNCDAQKLTPQYRYRRMSVGLLPRCSSKRLMILNPRKADTMPSVFDDNSARFDYQHDLRKHDDVELDHVWHKHPRMPYLILQGFRDAMVRTEPSPNGRYLWQFRKGIAYADTLEQAVDYVEAGAEFFQVHKRNPYA
jgi:hypothetical protein